MKSTSPHPPTPVRFTHAIFRNYIFKEVQKDLLAHEDGHGGFVQKTTTECFGKEVEFKARVQVWHLKGPRFHPWPSAYKAEWGNLQSVCQAVRTSLLESPYRPFSTASPFNPRPPFHADLRVMGDMIQNIWASGYDKADLFWTI